MNTPNVRITPEISQKYIIAKVKGQEVPFLWGNPNIEWHKDIKVEMEKAGLEIEEVKGGGRIKLIESTKTIYVWDKSTAFGEASFEEVNELLKTAFGNYKIINEMPQEG